MSDFTLKHFLETNLTRPIRMVAFEPMVSLFSTNILSLLTDSILLKVTCITLYNSFTCRPLLLLSPKQRSSQLTLERRRDPLPPVRRGTHHLRAGKRLDARSGEFPRQCGTRAPLTSDAGVASVPRRASGNAIRSSFQLRIQQVCVRSLPRSTRWLSQARNAAPTHECVPSLSALKF